MELEPPMCVDDQAMETDLLTGSCRAKLAKSLVCSE